MKKARLFSIILFFAALPFIFIACTKNDNPPSIVGNWELQSQHTVITGPPTSSSVITTDTTYVHGKSAIIALKSDKSYLVKDYSTSTSGKVTDSGTYNTTNATTMYIISAKQHTVDTATYSVNASLLINITTNTASGSVYSSLLYSRQ